MTNHNFHSSEGIQAKGKDSPHVLDLSVRINSIASEITGKVGDVRGGLQSADIGLTAGANPAEKLIAGATSKMSDDKKDEAELNIFHAYKAEYYGTEINIDTPRVEAKIRKIEKRNEKLLMSNPGKLLINFDKQPDAHVTARRYAAEIDQKRK